MNFLEKIIYRLSFKKINETMERESYKIAFFNALLSLFSIVCLVSSFYFYINLESIKSIILLSFFGLLLLNLFFLYKKRNKINLAISFFLGILSIYIILQLLITKSLIFTALSIGVLPIFAITLLQNRFGSYFLLFFSFFFLIFYFVFPTFSAHLTSEFKYSTLIIFLFIWATTFLMVLIFDKKNKNESVKLEALTKQIKDRNDFIDSWSNQIQLTLNKLNPVFELISDTEQTSEQIDLMNTLKATSANLLSQINALENIQSNREVSFEYQESLFNLTELINNSLKLYTQNSSNDIYFSTVFGKDLPVKLTGQVVKIRQILLNVIDFFIFYFPKENKTLLLDLKVDVSKELEDKYLIAFELNSETPLNFRIEDINKNKPEENLIYYITRSLIESIKGSMNVLNNPFHTLFSFTIELYKAQTPKKERSNIVSKSMMTRFKNKKIESLSEAVVLIVEDNLINQKIMVLSFKKLVSEIIIANNGQEALNAMQITNFDIVLMDIQMPVMDGLEASMRIRKSEKNGDQIPIIAITANALHGDRESCLAAGMNDYISKPFKLEVLLEKMKHHLKVNN